LVMSCTTPVRSVPIADKTISCVIYLEKTQLEKHVPCQHPA
jgi:hypothetical protein